MANHKSDYAKGIRQMPVAGGSELVSIRMEVSLPASHALNDIVEFGELPQDHVPVDFVLDSAALAASAMVLAVALLNAGKTDLSADADDGGASWLTGSTIGVAGGIARPTVRAMWLTKPKPATKRMVGAKITTGGVTPAAGVLALTLIYRAAAHGG